MTDPRPIRFGTSGWRGTLADEVTDERLRAFVAGAGRWLARRHESSRLLVAFDGRFASERLANVAAGELQRCGLSAVLAIGVTPTPALARTIVRRRPAGGLKLTASHNPAQDDGVKVFGARGEPVDAAASQRIEVAAERALLRPPRKAAVPGRRSSADFVSGYVRDLVRAGGEALRAAPRLSVTYDAMHGAGAGVLDAALRELGAKVELLRGSPDPLFGGAAPDPIPERLTGLVRRVRSGRGLRFGVATDGDADRIAAVDEAGRTLSEEEVAALVVDHLARTGRVRRGVVLTLASGSLVERVAASHGVRTTRLPIGFRFLASELTAGRAEVAVDESGGIAFAPFALDKDGMLAAMLLAESVALRREGLGAQRAALRKRHGSTVAGRSSFRASPSLQEGIDRLLAAPPERIEGKVVRDVDLRDGLRVELEDGFVMWRRSGTEPLIRVYAEAPGRGRLRSRLRAAERVLRRLSSGRG